MQAGPATLLAIAACGGTDEVVYADVAPIFAQRCTLCHYSGNAIDVDIEDPFEPVSGLVHRKNTWWEVYGEAGGPEFNVVPFEPEQSFLLDKLRDPTRVADNVGSAMPIIVEPLSAAELAVVRDWIDAGAEPERYQAAVFPIFGDGSRLGQRMGKCGYCHYAGTPFPPDLTQPFDPVVGLVGAPALFDPTLMRVEVGNADASFLVDKIELLEAEAGVGAPMPYPFDPLTDAELAVVRQWIVDGALP